VAIRDLAGTGALQEALTTTNEHLAAVLAELQRTNDERLRDVTEQLSRLNGKVDELVDRVSRLAGS
jgi:ubiquinone biosynthesis protein UbiJ